VTLGPVPFRVETGRSASLWVAFDPSHEPDFRGSLCVEVVGRDTTGVAVFRTTVDLTVRADDGNFNTGRPDDGG